MATPDGTLRVLSIGLDAISKAAVEKVFAGRANIEEAPTDLEKILELPTDPQPHMVICGPPPQGA
ncbi:MAG TPA: hypothetical protein PLU50_08230, partial [Pseudobdellovibrionaceae bacterium]|nr:hypothetical protein [Pseudobdellovibrionaceae bacterium]